MSVVMVKRVVLLLESEVQDALRIEAARRSANAPEKVSMSFVANELLAKALKAVIEEVRGRKPRPN